jgi:hypothetical protein
LIMIVIMMITYYAGVKGCCPADPRSRSHGGRHAPHLLLPDSALLCT